MNAMTLLAAGASPVNVQLISLITTIVVFLLFFFAAAYLVWPKILSGLDERELKIRREIESAEEARAEAAESLKRQEAELNESRREATERLAKAKADAEHVASELRRKAEVELHSMREQASKEIQAAKEAAIADLNAQAGGLATEIAGRILQREISAADQQDLINESLQSFAGHNN
ncbi:MAG: ATP synthase F0 subunit B [Phycisphaerae bacterium]|nr:ATP synthase F0 subunit B [Phycisphaerae bacterium]